MGRRRSGGIDSLVRQHDISALTVLGVLCLIGLWPLAALLVVFGFIGSLIND